MILLLRPYRAWVIAAFIGSILISLWSLYADGIINNDGVEYVHAANQILEGNWRDAMRLFKWPFYPFLLSLGSNISGLDAETVSYILNALFYGIVVVTFIALCIEYGGDRRVVIAAVFVILLLPSLNNIRSYVIRDPGYLAFYLLALLYFTQFYKAPSMARGIAGMGCLVLATLFRVEGLAFLAFTPFLFFSKRSRHPVVIILVLLALVGVVFIFGWWAFQPTRTLDYASIFHQPVAVIQNAWAQISQATGARLDLIEGKLLSRHNKDFGVIVLIITGMVIVIVESFGKLTIIHAGLIVYGLRQEILFPIARLRKLWLSICLINLVVLTVYIFAHWIVAPRYPLALALTLLIASPFALAHLWRRWSEHTERRGRRWILPTIVILLLLIGINGLDLATRKRHLKEAGIWLKDNVPHNASIYTNDKILGYYSGRETEVGDYYGYSKELLSQVFASWWGYDYIAIRIKRDQRKFPAMVMNHLRHKPDAIFKNDKADTVLIYKTVR